MAPNKSMRAADHLVEMLIAQGCSHVFGVPGESFLPVLDALGDHTDKISFVTCRQEGGAAMAAEAQGKLTKRPGVCMVTRGPGATNASAGVHIAYQDSTPMILFIGQVARGMIEREAFQEIDYRRMFGQMAKWVAQIDDPSRIQEFITRAYRVAMSGRPGPVVLALPEDMLYEHIAVPQSPARIVAPQYKPDEKAMDALQQRLSAAERPLVIAGGGGWTKQGTDALAEFAQKQGVPVAVSLRSQGLIDNDHPHYVGHLNVAPSGYLDDAVRDADLLIAVGARLGEMTTQGYSLLSSPVPEQALVHVFPAGEELGRVFEPALALVSDVNSFCQGIADWPDLGAQKFEGRTTNLRAAFEKFSTVLPSSDDALAKCFAHLDAVAPDNAIFCSGAGNYAGWLHRYVKIHRPDGQLAPTSGSMGYGLPAAVAAAITHPDRDVFAIAGDGCLMMTVQELATAMQFRLSLTVILVNNSRLGTIRAHQEREYPDRVVGTNFRYSLTRVARCRAGTTRQGVAS